ncbi:MAG TPA: hypothetical protein VGR84_18895 [Candidatus Acidoferrales bacterium]|nr:hypothetical protein [Candidatus Acidoferrales bacterium]
MSGSRLTLLGETPADDPEAVPARRTRSAQPTPQQQTEAQQKAAASMLMIALKALSQRFVVSVASLVDLVLFGAAFAIWWQIMRGPSQLQIIAASLFSMFSLAVIWMRRRN